MVYEVFLACWHLSQNHELYKLLHWSLIRILKCYLFLTFFFPLIHLMQTFFVVVVKVMHVLEMCSHSDVFPDE